MFLLRCLFWLGLVFAQIAQREGPDPAAFVSPVAGPTAGLGQMAAGAAGDHCRANPAQCLALASSLSVMAKIDAGATSKDTLTAADRAPPWKPRRAID
ncbi:hypothetical protein K9U39_09595 [Rhodoblastus acidophilus]|uniref:Uncharacterized protein n=1 Tax=Candidatus Rhodoblastus alkanivorans TaxID=2954117 RepID=A0ABS9Z863_9HYPH|nr:hypothetical protein [Candidatus Rhodoblastus alkanivorans]MCI4677980.1 hypothetical protein [Candidatus Rhodoblastus alkanivorans]MCI4683875.1 hypothetical protein [Candidatus Rhodoblastus alkanivorans]MDI4641193.1 hypothetical protein [Rhodoblastus acidophilus]